MSGIIYYNFIDFRVSAVEEFVKTQNWWPSANYLSPNNLANQVFTCRFSTNNPPVSPCTMYKGGRPTSGMRLGLRKLLSMWDFCAALVPEIYINCSNLFNKYVLIIYLYKDINNIFFHCNWKLSFIFLKDRFSPSNLFSQGFKI